MKQDRQRCPEEITTHAAVSHMEAMVYANRQLKTGNTAGATGCSQRLAYSIMHDQQHFHKVCKTCIPREMNPEHKMTWMGLALEHLCHYEAEGEDTLNRTVTGDESRVHHFRPKSKHESMQWKHPSSLVTKNYSCPINRPDYADCFMGLSRGTNCPFSKSWWNHPYHIVILGSADT